MANTGKIYTPLSEPRKTIRILNFLEDDTDTKDPSQPLRIGLREVSLGSQSDYCALSYEWDGLKDRTRPDLPSVIVSGQPFAATTNLIMALSWLRGVYTSSQSYWIDAICINQQDNDEKSYQISLMRDIYQGAKIVFIWLGLGTERSDLAINFLQECMRHTRIKDRGQPEIDEDWLVPKIMNPSPDLLEIWHGVFELCSRPYWKRCWIVQEVVVAKLAMMTCGIETVAFLTFIGVIASFERCWAQHFEQLKAYRWELIQQKTLVIPLLNTTLDQKATPGGTADLLDLWVTFEGSQSSNPRDKIYSLVGLAKASGNASLTIRYGAQKRDVFTDVARYVIEDTRRLDVLAFAASILPTDVLPSWVPNWSCDYSYITNMEEIAAGWKPVNDQVISYKRRFQAGGPLDEPLSTLPLFHPNHALLEVKAIFLGPVLRCAVLQDSEEHRTNPLPRLNWVLDEVLADYRSKLEPKIRSIILPEVVNYVTCHLYEALFFSIKEQDIARASLNLKDFTNLCASCIPEFAHMHVKSPISERQRQLLVEALNPLRALLITSLPRPFCFADAVKELFADIPNEQMHRLRQVPFFQTFGFCRMYNIDDGDSVVVIPGCTVPLVLRKAKNPLASSLGVVKKLFKRASKGKDPDELQNHQYWEVAGEAFVQGVMRGEAVGKVAARTIFLR